ncbi:MAG: TetR/AcrR family transcriptional regulator [Rhodobiaceae bacterium]|nr:TetR/AcrR family transcriptional regulator [Rhodobiaceae bacterium]
MTKTPAKSYTAALTAAKALFAEHGYEAVSTAEIYTKANISNGSLFHHFKSKEGIAVAVFVELVRTYQAEIGEKLTPTTRAADGIDAFIRAHSLWIESDPDGARILFNGHHPSWSEGALREIRSVNQAFGQIIQDWRKGLDDGERFGGWSIALIMAMLIGPTQVLCRAWLAGQSNTPPSANIDTLVTLAHRALLD